MNIAERSPRRLWRFPPIHALTKSVSSTEPERRSPLQRRFGVLQSVGIVRCRGYESPNLSGVIGSEYWHRGAMSEGGGEQPELQLLEREGAGAIRVEADIVGQAPFLTTMPCLVARMEGSSTMGASSVTFTVAGSTTWNPLPTGSRPHMAHLRRLRHWQQFGPLLG